MPVPRMPIIKTLTGLASFMNIIQRALPRFAFIISVFTMDLASSSSSQSNSSEEFVAVVSESESW